jgi:carbonic anhydrase
MRLFILCSDTREKADLEHKTEKVLLVPGEKIAKIMNYGWPMVLAHPIFFPSEANALLGSIKFAIEEFHPEEIVSVGHDCGYYKMIPHLANTSLFDKKRDILHIHRMLTRRYPNQVFKSLFDVSDGKDFRFETISV